MSDPTEDTSPQLPRPEEEVGTAVTNGNGPMDNTGTKTALEFARDSSKQVLTLATAVLTLTLTFIDKVVKVGDLTVAERALLFTAWFLLVVSLAFGLLVLLNITGSASPTTRDRDKKIVDRATYTPSIYESGTQGAAAAQMVAFGVSLLLLVIFGLMTVNDPPAASSTTTTITTTTTLAEAGTTLPDIPGGTTATDESTNGNGATETTAKS